MSDREALAQAYIDHCQERRKENSERFWLYLSRINRVLVPFALGWASMAAMFCYKCGLL